MLKLSEFSTTKKQGDAGLAIAISYFVLNGFTVSIPLTDSQEYDLVVEINSQLKKVQVKTTAALNSKGNAFRAEIRTRTTRDGKNVYVPLDSSRVDYIFIFAADNKKYLIPTQELTNKTALDLTSIYSKYLV